MPCRCKCGCMAVTGNEFYVESLSFQLTSGWDTYTVEFTTEGPGGLRIGETIQLGFQIWSNTNGETVKMDNVTIVPEPATMCLLGLGVLLLRRRKA